MAITLKFIKYATKAKYAAADVPSTALCFIEDTKEIIRNGISFGGDLSGYLPLTGGTLTGSLTAPIIIATSYFRTPLLVGEGDNTSYYHRMEAGYAKHDYWAWYDYGGDFRFYRNTTSAATTSAPFANLLYTGCKFTTSIEATLFKITGGTSSYALLADGTTKLLTSITENCLPLTGGALNLTNSSNSLTINYTELTDILISRTSGTDAHNAIRFIDDVNNASGTYLGFTGTTPVYSPDNGTTWYDLCTTTALSNYLPLAGGTMTGELKFNIAAQYDYPIQISTGSGSTAYRKFSLYLSSSEIAFHTPTNYSNFWSQDICIYDATSQSGIGYLGVAQTIYGCYMGGMGDFNTCRNILNIYNSSYITTLQANVSATSVITTILDTKRVGINKYSPTVALDVVGDVLASATIKGVTGIYDGDNRVYSAGNNNIGTGSTNYASGDHTHTNITYLAGVDTRSTEVLPYATDYKYKLTGPHLKTNTTDGLSDGGTYHGSIFMSPWTDNSGGNAFNLGFTNNGNIWYRYGTSSWSSWVKLFTTNGGTISGDLSISGLLSVTGTYIKLSTGDLINGYTKGLAFNYECSTTVNTSIFDGLTNLLARFSTSGLDLNSHALSGVTTLATTGAITLNGSLVYHAGNANLSTVDWACNNLTTYNSVSIGHVTISDKNLSTGTNIYYTVPFTSSDFSISRVQNNTSTLLIYYNQAEEEWGFHGNILVNNNYVSLNGHTHAYSTLTGSTTTADLAIVSSGTANGWTLKTLGSNAFTSTSYLPLTGGTLTGGLYSQLIRPTSNNSYSLGSTSYRWQYLYTYYIGASSYPVSSAYITNLYSGAIRPTSNNSYNLGTTSYYWNNVYGNNFIKYGSSDSYMLLGGGGSKLLSDFLSQVVVDYELSNTDGYRLVLNQSINSAWMNGSWVFAITSRHAGNGIMIIRFTTGDTSSEAVFEVLILGTSVNYALYLKFYHDTANSQFKIFARMADYSGINITPISNYGSATATITTGTYYSSLPTITGTEITPVFNFSDTYLPLTGGTVTGNITATAFYQSSDLKLKENIQGIEDTYKVEKIDFKKFNFIGDKALKYGVIAQDLEANGLSNLVTEDTNGNKAVDYISLLVLEIQRLRDEVSNLKRKMPWYI